MTPDSSGPAAVPPPNTSTPPSPPIPQPSPPRILIVEDEPAIADTLAFALAGEGFVTEWHSLGRDALAAAGSGAFDLLILDVGLPDISGFDVCRELRRHSEVPMIFLTARSDEIDRIVGLELGADDYVAKPFSPREVVSRVRAILRRLRPRGDGAGNGGSNGVGTGAMSTLFTVDADGARIAWRGTWLSLTRYEYGLLATLVAQPGRIFSRAQLMQRVWQDAGESFERTVDAHVKTLRAKLRGVAGDDPIETHRGLGYSLRREIPAAPLSPPAASQRQ